MESEKSEYKACGKQLEVHPDAKGTPIDIWTAKQPLCAPGAVAKWLKDREAEAAKPKKTR